MRKAYVVDQSEEEKAKLKSLTEKGQSSARKLNTPKAVNTDDPPLPMRTLLPIG